MLHKSKVIDIFVEWRRRIKLQTGWKIKILRFDNEGEHKSDYFCSCAVMKALKDTS